MFNDVVQILVPLVCFSINVLVQLSCNRFLRSVGLLKSELIGFASGLLGVFVLELYIYSFQPTLILDLLAIFAANCIIFSSLSYCYFHFVNLAVTARRIRLLRDLYCSHEGLTMGEILARYDSRDMIENRVKRLINSGQIIYKNNRYYIGGPIVLWVSKIILMMKLIIIGKKSEFD